MAATHAGCQLVAVPVGATDVDEEVHVNVNTMIIDCNIGEYCTVCHPSCVGSTSLPLPHVYVDLNLIILDCSSGEKVNFVQSVTPLA